MVQPSPQLSEPSDKSVSDHPVEPETEGATRTEALADVFRQWAARRQTRTATDHNLSGMAGWKYG